MSAAMALRLLFGVLCGGVLAWVVWDRSERELADRAGREEHERPRFLPFGGYYYLPMMMLLYPILGVIVGGAQMAVQLTLGVLLRVFLEMSVYYVLLMAMMPWLRKWVSARVCAMLWLLPDWLYVFVGRLDRPTDGKMLVLHARVCAAGCLGRGRGGRDGPEDRVAPCIPPPDSEKRRSGHGPADAACLGDRAGTCVDPEMQVEARALRRGHDAAVYRSV